MSRTTRGEWLLAAISSAMLIGFMGAMIIDALHWPVWIGYALLGLVAAPLVILLLVVVGMVTLPIHKLLDR